MSLVDKGALQYLLMLAALMANYFWLKTRNSLLMYYFFNLQNTWVLNSVPSAYKRLAHFTLVTTFSGRYYYTYP